VKKLSSAKYDLMNFIKVLMFNGLVKQYIKNDFLIGLISNKRLKGMMLELLYTLFIFFPFLILLAISTVVWGDPLSSAFQWIDLMTIIPFSILLVGILNKDFFNGQSVIKRVLGYQIIDLKTAQPASRLKCMLRNMTAPLWPLEIIFILINAKRRIGDFIAGTQVVEITPTDPQAILCEIKAEKFNKQTQLILFLSILWALAFTVLFEPRSGIL